MHVSRQHNIHITHASLGCMSNNHFTKIWIWQLESIYTNSYCCISFIKIIIIMIHIWPITRIFSVCFSDEHLFKKHLRTSRRSTRIFFFILVFPNGSFETCGIPNSRYFSAHFYISVSEVFVHLKNVVFIIETCLGIRHSLSTPELCAEYWKVWLYWYRSHFTKQTYRNLKLLQKNNMDSGKLNRLMFAVAFLIG